MVQVKVSHGLLEGELVDNELCGKYYSFKGIPYAEPPVGDLRFKAPQPLKPWNGVRSAKEFGPVSLQYNVLIGGPPIGSEDCLYLNVYTPLLKPKTPLPVMVWIHGGGLLWGSGNDDMYGPELLIRHDVILVTFNYRLDCLGFLCLDTEDIPGNAGMKDQVAALRWVKKNISHFGGDSENITIFGESAGSASVSYHLVSPMSKGLFKRAIAQSGALTCLWAHCYESRERTLKLAKQLGCKSDDDKIVYEFLKMQPAGVLVNHKLPVILSAKTYELDLGIVSEKQFGDHERFFHGDVIDALKNNVHEGVDIIAGYTADEGLMGYTIKDNYDKIVDRANKYLEFFVPKPITSNCLISKQLEVGRKMKEFYFKNKEVSENKEQLHKFVNIDMFVHGITLFARLCASTKRNKVYFYKFTCKTERNVFADAVGVRHIIGDKLVTCHADDLCYLFLNKDFIHKTDIKSETLKIIDRVTTIWTNFAIHGNPTPDESLGVKWSPYTLEKQEYLEIGNELVAGTTPDREEIEFWDKIFSEYLPYYTT